MYGRSLSVLVLSLVLLAAPAYGLATRTWVNGNGSDANPCSYTAPCRTFSGAYLNTSIGGTISVQNPGSYGTLTISKSITVDGGGHFATVRHTTSDGVTVNFTASDVSGNVVVLRGLSFDSTGVGYGVANFSTATTHLHIEDCTFTREGAGIGNFTTGVGATMKLKNVSIRHSNVYGVIVSPPAGAAFKLTMIDVHVNDGGTYGLRVTNNTNGTVTDSSFQGNDHGASIENASVHLKFTRTIFAGNTNGLRHTVSGITTLIDRCSIFGNGTGISNTGSTVLGMSNNSIANNLTDVSGNAVQSLLQQ